jgi:hypothetical protein
VLIAEDVLLLALDDEKGKPVPTVEPLLGGALLAELALMGVVAIPPKEGWTEPKVVLLAPTDMTDPVLAAARDVVAAKPRRAADLVTRLGRGQAGPLADRLAARGMVRREQTHVLGLFPSTRWPAADLAYENALRAHLAAVLAGQSDVDARSATVIALLHGAGAVGRLVVAGMSAREVRERAKRIAEGDRVAQAVRAVIVAANAAVVAAVASTTVIATS